MKKYLLFYLILPIFFPWPLFAEDLPLIISGMDNYPPVMWRENKKYVGIADELVRKIFDEMGVKYEFKILPWKRAQEEARSGTIDLITGIYWNSERDKFLDYTKPFMVDPAVLFIRKGHSFPFDKWSDLIGKKGIMNQGYSWGEGFDKFMAENLKVIWINDPQQGFAMLSRPDRGVDYYLYGLLPGLIVINRLNLKDQVDYMPNYITEEKFYMAFSKKSSYSKLIPEVNAVIDRLVNEKFVDFLLTKYINFYQDNHLPEKR
jgi:polar amino acid transport system substrate-binding protein